MNRTKIEWTDYTWNPITGCERGCWYCYAKKIYTRFHRSFKPTFHPDRLSEPSMLATPAKIFCCSVSDIFAPWTPNEWRDTVLKAIFNCPVKHTFQLLTKNPERIPDISFPDNVWVGATVTNEDSSNDHRNIPSIVRVKAKVRFVSFEPLLGRLPYAISLRGIDWVIIGKLTGSRKVELKTAWVEDIMAECDRESIPVFMKNNLIPFFEKEELRQEFPKC